MASQEMPPPGGFADIRIKRVPPKPMIRQATWFGITIALTINGFGYLRDWRKQEMVRRIEQCEFYIAAQPFLVAEQERLFLKHLRTLREEERELMKDHPGWKLGTLYGEPVYKTLPKDQLPPLQGFDYYVHRSKSEWFNHYVQPNIHT